MKKLVKIAIFAAVGWLVGEVVEDGIEALGVPKPAATIAGGIVGAVV